MSDYMEYYKKAWELGLIKQAEEIKSLKSENARYREALEFYANNGGSLWTDAGGLRAREALKGGE